MAALSPHPLNRYRRHFANAYSTLSPTLGIVVDSTAGVPLTDRARGPRLYHGQLPRRAVVASSGPRVAFIEQTNIVSGDTRVVMIWKLQYLHTYQP